MDKATVYIAQESHRRVWIAVLVLAVAGVIGFFGMRWGLSFIPDPPIQAPVPVVVPVPPAYEPPLPAIEPPYAPPEIIEVPPRPPVEVAVTTPPPLPAPPVAPAPVARTVAKPKPKKIKEPPVPNDIQADIKQAIKEQRIINGMTVEQANQALSVVFHKQNDSANGALFVAVAGFKQAPIRAMKGSRQTMGGQISGTDYALVVQNGVVTYWESRPYTPFVGQNWTDSSGISHLIYP